MIRPGLGRIIALLGDRPFPWTSIHVAGTNGKGSISSYISRALTHLGLRTGRFTSPHVVHRWDGIAINDVAVEAGAFAAMEQTVLARDRAGGIGASEFELLTATAFEIFTAAHVDVAVVECGMGGREDATNVLSAVPQLARRKAATVISRVGLDHQRFLGTTLKEIAYHKAGIMVPMCPCVVEADSPPAALEEIARAATEVEGVELHQTPASGSSKHLHNASNASRIPESCYSDDHLDELLGRSSAHGLLSDQLTAVQRRNLWCAYLAVRLALPRLPLSGDAAIADALVPVMRGATLPGRYQYLSVAALLPERSSPVLMDGAHNDDAFQALATYVDLHVRLPDEPRVTWVLAFSAPDKARSCLDTVLRPGDSVVGVEFGPVDGMPWVVCCSAEEIEQIAAESGKLLNTSSQTQPKVGQTKIGMISDEDERPDTKPDQSAAVRISNYSAEHSLLQPLSRAVSLAAGGPLIIAGSLYLIGDVTRHLRRAELKAQEDLDDMHPTTDTKDRAPA